MTRSEKIRRFYMGKDREAKIVQIAYAQSTADTMAATLAGQGVVTMEALELDRSTGEEFLERARKIVSTLQRQVFVLDNPKVAFEIRKTGDEWSQVLQVATSHSSHWLYRVIFSEEDEVLFKMTWSGRTY